MNKEFPFCNGGEEFVDQARNYGQARHLSDQAQNLLVLSFPLKGRLTRFHQQPELENRAGFVTLSTITLSSINFQSSLNQSQALCLFHGLSTTVYLQLFVHFLEMGFYRVDGDEQFPCNFFVGMSGSNQFQYFQLAIT